MPPTSWQSCPASSTGLIRSCGWLVIGYASNRSTPVTTQCCGRGTASVDYTEHLVEIARALQSRSLFAGAVWMAGK
jgi:hypothetical protein